MNLRTMLAAGAMTVLGVLPVFLLTAQSVLVRRDLDFSEARLGVAVSVFFFAASATAFLAGPWIDALGRRTSTLVAGGMAVATGLGIAAGASSYGVLVALLVLGGATNATLQTTANLTLARAVAPHRRGLGFGVKQSAIPTAILLAGLAVPALGVAAGWRTPYWIAAVAGLLVVLTGLRLEGREGRSRTRSGGIERAPAGAIAVSALGMVLASASMNSLSAFLPAWAFEVGLTPSAAGLLLAAGSAASVLARIWGGAAADRRHGRNLPVVAAQLVAGALGCVLLALDTVPTLVAGTLVAFAIGWAWPGLLLFAVVRVGRENPAGASSAVQSGAFLGGAAGPALFGLLLTATSYPLAWCVAAALLTVAAALMLVARAMFLADLRRRPPRHPLDEPRPG